MSLTPKQKQMLRGMAHKLSPVVIIGGSGLTESVIEEIKQTIDHHELIKIKINAGDRTARAKINEDISTKCQCEHVQSIGRIGVFYKPSDQQKIQLPR